MTTGLSSLVKEMGVNAEEIEDLTKKISIRGAQEGYPSQSVSQLYSYAWFHRRQGSVVLHYLVRENSCFTKECKITFALTKKVLALISINEYQHPSVSAKVYIGDIENVDYGYEITFMQDGSANASVLAIVDKISVRLEAPDVHRFVHMVITITPLKEVIE